MFARAHRDGLLTRPLTDEVYRWGRTGSLSPVFFFLASVPLAFVSTTLAVLLWAGAIPMGIYLDRRKPPGADELLLGG